MPYGISPFRFVNFCIVATLTTLSGAQCTHMYYRPLDDLDMLVEEALKERGIKRLRSTEECKDQNKLP